MEKELARLFKRMGKALVPQILNRIQTLGLVKADVPVASDLDDVVSVDITQYLEDIAQGVVPKELAAAGSDAAAQTLAALELDPETFRRPSEEVWEYARMRAAELVGKKWVDGELVDNPNAEWSIDESTREMLRDTVSMGISSGMTIDELQDALEEDYAFSPERARMIARTEVITAHNQGAMSSYRAAEDAGLKVYKEWIVTEDDLTCEVCNENADAGPIPLDETFPSGDDAPSAHPNCRCSIAPSVQYDDD